MTIQQIQEYLESPEEEPDNEDDNVRNQDRNYRLTNTLMYLCMLVVMQDISCISLYDSPMMHYLAVRSVDLQREVLQSAFHYMPILASML